MYAYELILTILRYIICMMTTMVLLSLEFCLDKYLLQYNKGEQLDKIIVTRSYVGINSAGP